jgi:hypothetical protein
MFFHLSIYGLNKARYLIIHTHFERRLDEYSTLELLCENMLLKGNGRFYSI